jgi:hypothetical protein
MDYPGDVVRQEPKAVGYLTAALRAGVYAVRRILNSEAYKEVHGYDEIPVDMEAPMEGTRYPYVHVMYRDKGIQPITLEESEYAVYEEDGEIREDEYHIYKFNGSYMLNLYARTILERETLSDCMIGAIGIDDDFFRLLQGNEWIAIAPNLHTFSLGNSNESWGTPWSADEMTAFRQLTFDVMGEFCYRKSNVATYIKSMRITGHVRS